MPGAVVAGSTRPPEQPAHQSSQDASLLPYGTILAQYDYDNLRESGERFDLRAVYALLNVLPVQSNTAPTTLVPIMLNRMERHLFEAYDTDYSGGLDREQLERLLRDLFELAVTEAEQQEGASAAWVARAKEQLASDYGAATVRKAAEQLLKLRDANRNGQLEFTEIQAALTSEERLSATFQRRRFWRLAPLCDVPVDMDRLTNGPWIKGKIFAAGAISGMLAKTATSPLSRLTILLQTGGMAGATVDGSSYGLARHILRTEGVRGFFRGNAADILRQIPYAGLQFLTFETLKQKLRAVSLLKNSDTGRKMLAGGIAGGVSIVATYPLDLVRARLSVQTTGSERYAGVLDALRTISREDGSTALFRGSGTAVAERFPNMAINFACYDNLKGQCLVHGGLSGLWASLACGAVAGWISTTVTFPFDLVMRNQQLARTGGGPVRPLSIGRSIVRNDGIRGLYRGLGPQLAKAIPFSVAAWASYDKMKQVLHFEVR